jgi:hypothetical protein
VNTTSRIHKLIWVGLAAAGITGGCKCGGGGSADTATINTPTILETDPEARAPEVVFPDRLRPEDRELNGFIDKAIQVCARGDYDEFRELFSVSYAPPGRSEFTNIWHAISRLEVQHVITGPADSDQYYLLIGVERRVPDRQDRTHREVAVMVFREGGEWRIGAPPKEVRRRIEALSSRPAGDAADGSGDIEEETSPG